MTDVPSAELLARYRQHDSAAADALFHRFAERLTRLSRSRLSRKLAARVDAEDVVLSAYRSFFLLVRDGEVALAESGDLWRLLVRITLRKVYHSARRHRAECRSVDREQPWPEEHAPWLDEAMLDPAPTPAEAAALVDEVRCLLVPLDVVHRQIVEMRLQGHEIEEIARAVERSARTVRRTLAGLGEELQQRLLAIEPPLVATGESPALRYSDFLLQRQLGAGGMGKVYQALRRTDGVLVAVKIVRKSLRQFGTTAARFLQEADLLARLHHPGIVAFHGLGLLPDGGHFLAMDLIEGSDLAKQQAAGPVPLAQALRWVREAADAIAHAHEQGVLHCDLKPSNLLLDRTGSVHVSDFGLGRLLAAGEDRSIGGTAGLMAPEQVDRAVGPLSPRTDVHGLGAVLFTLVTGQPPFAGAGSSISLPACVASLCERCLALEPRHRLASAATLATALRAIERDLRTG